MSGFFITIEGIEGAGKTTALNFIKKFFTQINLPATFTREPGGTANAEQIRQLLLSKKLESPLPETELMLMFASRLEHTRNLILPALNADNIVVSDRYYDASYAYQGGGRLLNPKKIDELRSWVLGDFTPNLTILLDVPISVSIARIAKRKNLDRIESEKQEFFLRVKEHYLGLARNNPRFVCIDSTLPLSEVEQQLKDIISSKLPDRFKKYRVE